MRFYIFMVVLSTLCQFQVSASAEVIHKDYVQVSTICGWMSVQLKFEGNRKEDSVVDILIKHQDETVYL